jgi:hypothetical protein
MRPFEQLWLTNLADKVVKKRLLLQTQSSLPPD